jgi:hypothetical protein
MLKQSSGLLPKEHQTLATPGEWLERSHSKKFAIEAKTTHRNSGLETTREQGDDMRNWVLTGCATLLAAVLTACPTTASKPEITAFTGTPAIVEASGTIVTLTWTTTGATDVALSAIPALATGQATVSTGTATVKDVKADTKFTLTAKNAAGDSVTKDFSVTLKAATGIAPKILSSVPANGAPGVAFANNTITVTFDKAMDLATTKAALTMTGGTAPNLVLSADLKTATITFTAPAEPAPTAAGASNTIGYSFAGTAKSSDGGTLAAVTQNYTTKKLVLLSIPATAGAAATSLSGSVIFTGGTGDFNTLPPCATPCPRNYYDAEIRAGDNDALVNGAVALANRAHKGFVGFNITTVPALTAANLVSAKITMTQLAPVGAPYSIPGTGLKLQAITSADLSTKFVDANKYDFYVAPFSATFDLSTDGTVGPKIATVTSALLTDITNRATYGNRSLYRLIFPTVTPNPDNVDDLGPGKSDGDNGEDLAVFDNVAPNLPKLEIVYSQ